MTLLLADAQPLWREIVSIVLRGAGMPVSATAATVEQLRERALHHRPEVIVTDVRLEADGDVARLLPELVAELPDTRVLILAAAAERADVTAVVRAGAAGYVLKTLEADELVDAVRRTAAGESVVPAEVAGLVLGEYRRAVRLPRHAGPQLTARETEVLRMLGRGMAYRDIADELYLSPRTVQNHAAHLMRKLHRSSRVELALYAVEHGYTT